MATGTSLQIDRELARLPEASGCDPELVARTAAFVDYVRGRCRGELPLDRCVDDCTRAILDLSREVLPGAPAAIFALADDGAEPIPVRGGPPTAVEALRQWLLRSPPKLERVIASKLLRLACVGDRTPIYSHCLGPASSRGGQHVFVIEAPSRAGDLHPEIRLLGLAASALQDGLELRALSDRVSVTEGQTRSGEEHSAACVSEVRPFDLAHLVDEQVAFVAAHADPGSVGLVARYAPEAPRSFVGDAGALRSIIRHLLYNGLLTSKLGEVVVRVDCEARVEGRARMCITVDDTGIGYTDVELEAIFEASMTGDHCDLVELGERVDGTEPARLLARIREELARFGGDLGGTSHPGEGSTFFATLDLEEAP